METISRSLLTFLLNSVWQIPLVTGVAALACYVMRKGPASHRHAVWVAALVAGVLLPLASIRSGQHREPWQATVSYTPSASVPSEPTPASARLTPARLPATNTRSVPFGQTSAAVVVGVYFLFLLFRLGKLVWAWVRTIQIQQSAEARSTPPLLEEVWARCLQAFGLSGVWLLSSPRVSSPLMAGVWRKTIILPDSLFAETSEDVLTTAVGHEMAHIARHDFAFNVLYELLYLPVSFHPAAWFIRRGIERTREMACDELVTRELIDAGVYARSLMSIAVGIAGSPRPGYTLGVFDGDILEERIRRLVERPVAKLKRARLLLVSGLSALAVCAVIASSLALTAHAQSSSHEEMNLAGAAYNQGDFKTSVQHFENAVKLDSANINTKLFLAHALIRESLAEKAQPGNALMNSARQQYLDVLALDPQEKLAMQGMMVAAMDAKRFSEAHDWVLKMIQLDPKEKGAYYTAAVLDWATVFPEFQRAKQAAGGRAEDYFIPDSNMRKNLRDQFLPQIEDGFRMLQIALQLDPNYADAMAYMNLLDRLKSGLVDSAVESKDLLSKADDWVGKALNAKRRTTQSQPPPTAIDVDGPPPGPASTRM